MQLKFKLILFVLYITNTCHCVPNNTDSDNESKQDKISRIIVAILKNYDKAFRPDNKEDPDAPLEVNVSINIHSFGQFNAHTMQYSLLVDVEQTWFDMRLVDTKHEIIDSINLSGEKEKIWVPDLYFPTSVEGKVHSVTQSNRLIWFDPDGRVTYMQKLTVKLTCMMDFSRYPMDNQMCPVDIGSYGFKRKDLKLGWRFGDNNVDQNVQLDVRNLNELEIIRVETTSQFACGKVDNEQRPCIQAKFYFRRNLQYYIMHTYLPNILIVTVSWLSFLIDFTVAPARVTLSLVAVLTIITQTNLVYQGMPKISYIKAIDVWLFTCLTFVILALLEFAFVNSFCREGMKPMVSIHGKIKSGLQILTRTNSKSPENIDQLNLENLVLNEEQHEIEPGRKKKKWFRFKKSTGYKADGLFFVLYPILFIIFNICYWSIYISLEN